MRDRQTVNNILTFLKTIYVDAYECVGDDLFGIKINNNEFNNIYTIIFKSGIFMPYDEYSANAINIIELNNFYITYKLGLL